MATPVMTTTMKKAYFLIAFLVLLLGAIIYFFGAAASIVPGWHTTIYPPWYSGILVIMLTLFFAAIGYWLYLKQISKLNWVLFVIYFLVTASTYFFIKFPFLFLKFQEHNQEEMFATARNIVLLLPAITWVLIITQVLLVGYVGYIVIRRKMIS
jgi:hypothetical protein